MAFSLINIIAAARIPLPYDDESHNSLNCRPVVATPKNDLIVEAVAQGDSEAKQLSARSCALFRVLHIRIDRVTCPAR